MQVKAKLVQTMRDNETVVQVFPADELLLEWEKLRNPTRNLANFVAPALDAATLAKLTRELGLFGKSITQKVGQKTYIIFKGYPGQRKILRGTRYLATNPKVVRLAIGPKGVLKSVRGGAVLTAVLFTGINILEYLFRDSVALHTLLGTLSSDLVKIGLASVCAALAGLAVGSATIVAGVAGAPLFAAIAVGVLVGFTLDTIDERLGATKALIEFYESIGIELTTTWSKVTSMSSFVSRELARWEQRIVKQAIRQTVRGY